MFFIKNTAVSHENSRIQHQKSGKGSSFEPELPLSPALSAACLADFFGLIALPWASLTCVALSVLAFLVVSPLTPDRQGAR